MIELTGVFHDEIELTGVVKTFVKATPESGNKRGQPIGMLLTLTHPVTVNDIVPVELTGNVGTFETEA